MKIGQYLLLLYVSVQRKTSMTLTMGRKDQKNPSHPSLHHYSYVRLTLCLFCTNQGVADIASNITKPLLTNETTATQKNSFHFSYFSVLIALISSVFVPCTLWQCSCYPQFSYLLFDKLRLMCHVLGIYMTELITILYNSWALLRKIVEQEDPSLTSSHGYNQITTISV